MLVFFFVLALVVFCFQWIYNKKNRQNAVELLLISVVVFCFGLNGIGNFIAYIFYPQKISTFTGWALSPFQFEVGIANLAIGALAILAFWMRSSFLLGAILANIIWFWGKAAFRIQHVLAAVNSAPSNEGIYLWADLLIPTLVVILYWQREKHLY